VTSGSSNSKNWVRALQQGKPRLSRRQFIHAISRSTHSLRSVFLVPVPEMSYDSTGMSGGTRLLPAFDRTRRLPAAFFRVGAGG